MSDVNSQISINSILEKYKIPSGAKLGSGMEADVFAYGEDKVLKIYKNLSAIHQLAVLTEFYAALDANAVSYALPKIYTCKEQGPFIVTIEKRLVGIPMSTIIQTSDSAEIEPLMGTYLSALVELQNVKLPSNYTRYKLYDDAGLSSLLLGDWHSFLARYLDQKRDEISRFLERDVTGFPEKLAKLTNLLARPYTGNIALIHGDFFPGNLLIDHDLRVTALLDFGLFTMFGDPLFDLATGWVFFDMYDELKRNLRARLLSFIVDRLGNDVMGKLHLYVLLYSIFSANTYSSQCADEHYQWCVANLNNERFWRRL